MKLLYIYLLFVMIGRSDSFGQEAGVISGLPRQYMGTMHSFQKIKKLLNEGVKENPVSFSDIKGSPYLYEEFKEGKIYLSDSLVDHSYIRYNIYSDEIEINENDQLFTLLKIKDSKVVIENDTLNVRNYITNSGEKEQGYFFPIQDGKSIKLYKRMRCTLTPYQKAATPNQKDRAPKFNLYTDYYIIQAEEGIPIKKIKLQQKHLLKLMKNKKDLIKNFLKEKNIDLKKEENLRDLFTYYNSL